MQTNECLRTTVVIGELYGKTKITPWKIRPFDFYFLSTSWVSSVRIQLTSEFYGTFRAVNKTNNVFVIYLSGFNDTEDFFRAKIINKGKVERLVAKVSFF